MKLEIYRGNGERPWRWRIKAGNNRVVGISADEFDSARDAAVNAHGFFWGIQESPYIDARRSASHG